MNDPLSRLSSAVADRYRIERELGAGGMATVYLAHDLRHDRQVALKVVKPEIVASVGADRFISEIRTTAHLKHPHILPLFDSGAAGDALFYVMPYIEGESLRGRLGREGALPITDAVGILRELADALAYAHAEGIVHRDVKPDNVLLSGRHVFLTDFGIARAVQDGGGSDSTRTATALVIGTPSYMAPEQAAGGPIDGRTDIYAFGAMAYEMLAGAPPFTGTAPAVLGAHMTEIPRPLCDVRPSIPPSLDRLVLRCLEKKAEDRWQRADDLVVELDAVSRLMGASLGPQALLRRGGAGAVGAAAALVAVAALIAAGWLLIRSATPPDVVTIGNMTHVTREPGLEIDPVLSPDGTTLAYVAGPPGKRRMYVRQIAGGRPIPLTEEGSAEVQRKPDWSPDGARIVFQAGRQGIGVRANVRTGTLYIVPALGGGLTRLIPPVANGVAMSPAWSPDGKHIAYAGADGIYLVSAERGGQPGRLVHSVELPHSVRWSPDGARLAYVAGAVYFALGEEQLGNTENSSIHVFTVATGEVEKVTSGQWLDVSPVWMPGDGGLLFVSNRGGGRDVYRVRFDRAGHVAGDPERITSGLNAHSIALSGDGTRLAYSSFTLRANIWSVAIPKNRIATVADAQQVTFGSEKTEKMVVSPDGRWLAYDSDRNGNADVWKVRIGGGEPEQVTRDPANEFANDWSPDGQRILFHTIRGGTGRDVMVVNADGTGIEAVAAGPIEEQHGSSSPDGNSVAYSAGVTSGETHYIVVTSRAGPGAAWGPPRKVTTGTGIDPKWSPDGQTILYNRRGEVGLVSHDGTNERVIVKGRGVAGEPLAQYAIWSPDGQTIYYKAHDDERRATIWSVPATGGTPRLLVRFDDPARPSLRREFATDGQRFYFTIAQDESDIWVAELRR